MSKEKEKIRFDNKEAQQHYEHCVAQQFESYPFIPMALKQMIVDGCVKETQKSSVPPAHVKSDGSIEIKPHQ